MKKVIDAVNELKGEWVDGRSYVYHSSNTNSMYRGKFDYTYQMHSGRGWDLVCTAEEFIATVAECETNFGECDPINVSHYKLADKVLLDKELDVMEGINKGDLIRIKGKIYKLRDHFATTSSRHQELIDSGFLEQEPQPTPIFTQEMADNDVLPSVGMECIAAYCKSEVKVTIAHINSKKQFACIDDNGDYLIHYPKEGIGESFKPLTPPITLIDGKAYQFEARGNVFHGIYEKRIGSFNVMTGQFFNTISCTNIQPLTVEVK